MDRLIIGVTGAVGSGCSEITRILEQSGKFIPFRISKYLTAQMKKRDPGFDRRLDKVKRKKLQDLGDELRRDKGHGFLARVVIQQALRLGSKKNIVIDSIKNPGEIDEIRRYPRGYVIAVNAPFDERWFRCQDKYIKDQRQFAEDDERDHEGKDKRGNPVAYGQQVQKCVDLADVYIKNGERRHSVREKEEFTFKLNSHLSVLNDPGSRRPTFLELMMNNAYCMSLRSRCLKRQVGAIITMQASLDYREETLQGGDIGGQRIISSGFNNLPRGQLSCKDEHKGCYRDKLFKEFNEKWHTKNKDVPGKFLNLCRSIHAEENAILQTCQLGGMPLTGATLYTTTFPCSLCAKKIVGAGIGKVVWLEPYPDKEAKEFLDKAGVVCEEFEGIKAQSFFKLFKPTLN